MIAQEYAPIAIKPACPKENCPEKEYPNLRFKGFTDAWEQRKIKDYASYRRGSFPQPYGKKEWYDGKDSMPFVQVVDVKENLRLVDHTKQRISKLAQPQSVYAQKYLSVRVSYFSKTISVLSI